MTEHKLPFPQASFIGFDTLLGDLNHAFKHGNDHYPPHNIIKTGDTSDHDYQIEIAVAGFSEDEINVELSERLLTVTGEHVSRGREFIHRGISTKKFRRTFRLSEYVEVIGASMKDGLLVIDLKVIVPEEKLPRKIKITRGKNGEENY